MRWLPLMIFFVATLGSASGAPTSLDELLKPIRDKAGLPALAGAVVRSNSIIAAGAIGVRKAGSTNAVSVEDKFHLGSCTKAMTATLVGMLVDEGHLAWTNTIGASFPDWTDINSNYARVTMTHLLSHRAGIIGDLTKTPIWREVWKRSKLPPIEQRAALARQVLAAPPAGRPGSAFIYANAGYTVAGVMIERREQRPWEDLLKEKLFKPLGMESAGFGVTATPGQVDQPWGHVWRDGKAVPIPPGPSADNPAAIGPGGTVHCSITDFAKFAQLHLDGAKGNARLLKLDTFRRLHRPPAGDYALGWGVGQRPWAKGRVLTHLGSNTMNTSVVWIAPEVDFAVVIASNLGGKEAELACDEAVSKLIQHFLN